MSLSHCTCSLPSVQILSISFCIPVPGSYGNFYLYFDLSQGNTNCPNILQFLSQQLEILPSVLPQLIMHFFIMPFVAHFYFGDPEISIFLNVSQVILLCRQHSKPVTQINRRPREDFPGNTNPQAIYSFSSRDARFFPPTYNY